MIPVKGISFLRIPFLMIFFLLITSLGIFFIGDPIREISFLGILVLGNVFSGIPFLVFPFLGIFSNDSISGDFLFQGSSRDSPRVSVCRCRIPFLRLPFPDFPSWMPLTDSFSRNFSFSDSVSQDSLGTPSLENHFLVIPYIGIPFLFVFRGSWFKNFLSAEPFFRDSLSQDSLSSHPLSGFFFYDFLGFFFLGISFLGITFFGIPFFVIPFLQ